MITENDLSNKENKYRRLTIDELRQCKGFENVNENEANKIIDTIFDFSIITYKVFCHG